MVDQSWQVAVFKRLKVLLEVCLCGLGAGADRVRVVLECCSCGGELEEVRAGFLLSANSKSVSHITANDQKAYAIWPPSVDLRVVLRLCIVSLPFGVELTVCNRLHDTRNGHSSSIEHTALHRLLAHRVTSVSWSQCFASPQDTGIRCQSSNSDTDMVVDLDQLLLVRC